MYQVGTQYQLIYRDIVTNVYAGKWKKGERLPSLPELCRVYDAGRNTVRRALYLLKENGFIEMEPRKPGVVSFDLDNPKYKQRYLKEIARRKKAVSQVFQFMSFIMPELFTMILAGAEPEKRKWIAKLVQECAEFFSAESEQECADKLVAIYKKALALQNNSLLDQMFLCVFYFIQIPLSSSERQGIAFKMMVPFIKVILKKFQKQIEMQDYESLKKQIGVFCSTIGSSSVHRLEKVCKNISIDKDEEFVWMLQTPSEMDYMLLASTIIKDIRQGVYSEGDILPSYAQMAAQAGVSEKTSRSAIKILNQVKLVSTINGIGSRVNSTSTKSMHVFLHDPLIKQNLKTFIEGMELLTLLIKPIIITAMKNAEPEQVEIFKAELKQKQLLDMSVLYKFFFFQTGCPLTEALFDQLSAILEWGYLLNFCWQNQPKQTQQHIQMVIELIDRKDYKQLAEYIHYVCNNALVSAVQFLKQDGIELE